MELIPLKTFCAYSDFSPPRVPDRKANHRRDCFLVSRLSRPTGKPFFPSRLGVLTQLLRSPKTLIPTATFRVAIGYVVFLGSKKEVPGIHTERVIAAMTNHQTFWDRMTAIKGITPRIAVGQRLAIGFSLQSPISIVLDASIPKPTTRCRFWRRFGRDKLNPVQPDHGVTSKRCAAFYTASQLVT